MPLGHTATISPGPRGELTALFQAPVAEFRAEEPPEKGTERSSGGKEAKRKGVE